TRGANASPMVRHPREIEEPDDGGHEPREEQHVEPVEQRHEPGSASNSIVTASARLMRARAGSGHSGPGCDTPSGPFSAAGIGRPSTNVPQRLTSWTKNRPLASRRSLTCSRETLELAATCTSTQAELPPRPI